MAWLLTVICPRRRLAAPTAEVIADALRAAGLDWQLPVRPRVGAASGGEGSR